MKPRRLGTAGTLALLMLMGGSVALVASAPRLLHGARFGHLVENALPATRGRIRVGGGRWTWKTVVALVRERPAELWLEDVHVIDPAGQEVLQVRKLFARVELHRADRRVVVRDLEADGIAWRFETPTSDRLGLVAALAPEAKTPDARPFSLSIPNAHLYRLNVKLELDGWGLSLDGARGLTASLSYATRAVGPPALSFEVTGAEVRDGGRLRVGPLGDAWTLPFSRVRLERVATTSDAPDAIRVEATDLATGHATSRLAATFHGVLAHPGPAVAAGLELEASCVGADDAVDALLAGRRGRSRLTVGGPQASLAFKVEGPYERLDLTGEAHGFTVAFRALRFEDIGFRLAATPSEGRYRLRGLSLDWPGVGRLTGGVLVKNDDGVTALRDVALTFTRPAAAPGPRALSVHRESARARASSADDVPFGVTGLRVSGGALEIPRLTVALWGGRLVARGRLDAWDRRHARWLPSPMLGMSLEVRRVSLERALGGGAFARGELSFRARVRGPLSDLTLQLDFPPGETVTVLGERFRFPRRATSLLTNGSLFLHADLKGAHGSGHGSTKREIGVTGRIGLSGKLGLDVDVDDFPFERLPGIADLPLRLTGLISGHLLLGGRLDAPTLAGSLAFDPVVVDGRSLGSGSLAITTEPSGDLRARGPLVDGIVVDGTLSSEPAGPRGRVALTLRRLQLEPFVPTLPGALAVRGLASGTLVARIAPGQPGSLEGHLSALTLAVARTATSRPVEVTANGPVALSARAGDGAVSLGPARFRGEAGAFELTVLSRAGVLGGTLDGRVELAALAPLLAPWLDRPSGSLELGLRVASVGGPRGPSVVGDVSVATPLTLRLADRPFSARVPSGRLHFSGHEVQTTALPIVFDARLPARGPISRAEGSARVDATVATDGRAPKFHARVDVAEARLTVPALGATPAFVEGARLDLRGDTSTLDERIVAAVDVPVRGEVRHFRTSVGMVDRATFALRLRGIPRKTLTLSGDVEVIGARLRADALRGASPTSPPAIGPPPSPELRDARLDVRLRSRGGVTIELGAMPDVHLELDLHVGGTEAHPVMSGEVRPAGAYSTAVMLLHRLFE